MMNLSARIAVLLAIVSVVRTGFGQQISYELTQSQLIAIRDLGSDRGTWKFHWEKDSKAKEPQSGLLHTFEGHPWWTTDATLEAASNFPEIEVVYLAYCCRISDEGIEKLKSFKSLRTLELYRNSGKWGGYRLPVPPEEASKLKQKLTDKCLHHIAEFPSLEFLNIVDNSFSESAILMLGRLKTLRKLCVDSNQVSPSTIHKLEELLPNCEIEVDLRSRYRQ